MIDDLRKLAEAATPGPWHAVGINGPDADTVITSDDDPVCHAHPADVAYIAAVSPTVVLALLDAVQEILDDANCWTTDLVARITAILGRT